MFHTPIFLTFMKFSNGMKVMGVGAGPRACPRWRLVRVYACYQGRHWGLPLHRYILRLSITALSR